MFELLYAGEGRGEFCIRPYTPHASVDYGQLGFGNSGGATAAEAGYTGRYFPFCHWNRNGLMTIFWPTSSNLTGPWTVLKVSPECSSAMSLALSRLPIFSTACCTTCPT